MKRNLVFLFSFVIALCAMAQGTVNYQVLRFTSPKITINGKIVKEKMTFKSDAKIEWATEPPVTQILEVKNLSTGMICRYSNRQFKSKQSASIKDFYLRTNKTSTRDANMKGESLLEGANKNKFGDKRIALVVGNSDYTSLGYLRNAMTDAARMSEKLQKLGFDVLEGYECRYEEMRTLLNNFATYAKGYDVALIYYSGHGVQESNVNYMVPIEAKLESVGSLHLCVAASEFVDKLDKTGCETKILVFDACRNPKTSWSRSANAGLAIMEGTPGMTITFSTQNGKVASDGEGDCSPFAQAMLDNMEADASFSDMMRNVVKQTYNATSNTQFPITTGMLLSDFKFNPNGKQLADVKATKAKPIATSGHTPQKPTTAPKKDVAAPKFSWNNRNISITVDNAARLVGDCAIFTIVMENKTGHKIWPKVSYAGTNAYHNASGRHTPDDGYLKIGNQRVGSLPFTLPEGVPVTMEMVVSPVSAAATMLKYVELNLENAEGLGDYQQTVLKIKNLPIVTNPMTTSDPAPTPSTASPTASWNNENIALKFGNAARLVGDCAIFTIVMENKTNHMIRPRLQSVGTMAYDNAGGMQKDGDIYLKIGNQRVGYPQPFTLPEGVPVTMEVVVSPVSAAATMLNYVELDLEGAEGLGDYQLSVLKIKNLPILK